MERFYRKIYGENVPVITSAVITGRAKLRLPSKGGIYFPGRFRFRLHTAGKDYRHYFEITFIGMKVMTVNEHYLDGKSHFVVPIIGASSGPQVDYSANLADCGQNRSGCRLSLSPIRVCTGSQSMTIQPPWWCPLVRTSSVSSHASIPKAAC